MRTWVWSRSTPTHDPTSFRARRERASEQTTTVIPLPYFLHLGRTRRPTCRIDPYGVYCSCRNLYHGHSGHERPSGIPPNG